MNSVVKTIHHCLDLMHNYSAPFTRPSQVVKPEDRLCLLSSDDIVRSNESFSAENRGNGPRTVSSHNATESTDMIGTICNLKSLSLMPETPEFKSSDTGNCSTKNQEKCQRTVSSRNTTESKERYENCGILNSNETSDFISSDTGNCVAVKPKWRKIAKKQDIHQEHYMCEVIDSQPHDHFPSSKRDKKFVCDICNKSFQYDRHLKKHYRQHTTKDSYKCNYCNQCFQGRYEYLHHLLMCTRSKDFTDLEEFPKKQGRLCNATIKDSSENGEERFCNKFGEGTSKSIPEKDRRTLADLKRAADTRMKNYQANFRLNGTSMLDRYLADYGSENSITVKIDMIGFDVSSQDMGKPITDDEMTDSADEGEQMLDSADVEGHMMDSTVIEDQMMDSAGVEGQMTDSADRDQMTNSGDERDRETDEDKRTDKDERTNSADKGDHRTDSEDEGDQNMNSADEEEQRTDSEDEEGHQMDDEDEMTDSADEGDQMMDSADEGVQMTFYTDERVMGSAVERYKGRNSTVDDQITNYRIEESIIKDGQVTDDCDQMKDTADRNEEMPLPITFICEKCNSRFMSEKALSIHYRQHSSFQCSYCSEAYKYTKHLYRRMPACLRMSPFLCNIGPIFHSNLRTDLVPRTKHSSEKRLETDQGGGNVWTPLRIQPNPQLDELICKVKAAVKEQKGPKALPPKQRHLLTKFNPKGPRIKKPIRALSAIFKQPRKSIALRTKQSRVNRSSVIDVPSEVPMQKCSTNLPLTNPDIINSPKSFSVSATENGSQDTKVSGFRHSSRQRKSSMYYDERLYVKTAR